MTRKANSCISRENKLVDAYMKHATMTNKYSHQNQYHLNVHTSVTNFVN